MHIYVQSVNNNPGERIIGQAAPSLGTLAMEVVFSVAIIKVHLRIL